MPSAAALPLPNITACCSPASGGVLSEEAADQLARIFKALGDPTRVRLVSLIAAREQGEACVCDLTDAVPLSQPTVSHHLRLLVDAGLISREQRGRWAYYRILDGAMRRVARALADG